MNPAAMVEPVQAVMIGATRATQGASITPTMMIAAEASGVEAEVAEEA